MMDRERTRRDPRRTKIWALTVAMGVVSALAVAFAATFEEPDPAMARE